LSREKQSAPYGVLVTTVLDILHNAMDIAILIPPPAHMPDVLEMPYRPNVTERICRIKKPTPTDWPDRPAWQAM
jgi:hypothetical protein